MKNPFQWLDDWRWALTIKRARAYRRKLSFEQRLHFDEEFRPAMKYWGAQNILSRRPL